MKNDKVVYIHRKKSDDTIFYVGIGNPDRPYQASRNDDWHATVKKYGYYTEVLFSNMYLKEAFEIEHYLVDKFGRKHLGLGNLVNKKAGGEGVAVFNIDTGELFPSIAKAAKSSKYARNSINEQLLGTSTIQEDNRFREVENPYPNNTSYWANVNEYETSLDEGFKVGAEDNNYLFDDEETSLLERINKLPELSRDLLEMSYNMSVREIAEETGINYMKVFRTLKKSTEIVLGDRINEYNNKKVKFKK